MQLPNTAMKTLDEYQQDFKTYLQAVIDEDLDMDTMCNFEEWLDMTLEREIETGEPDYYY